MEALADSLQAEFQLKVDPSEPFIETVNEAMRTYECAPAVN
jgi:hypothetical protein